jgi:uncharacterized protein with PIN domain
LIDTDQDHHTQLQLIVRTFGWGDGGSFIRCLECNTLFLSKSKEAARERSLRTFMKRSRSMRIVLIAINFFGRGNM